MNNCPFCGCDLETPINDGITCCSRCHRLIEGNRSNRLSALWWVFKKYPNFTKEQIMFQNQVTEEEYSFVERLFEAEYSFEDFLIELAK